MANAKKKTLNGIRGAWLNGFAGRNPDSYMLEHAGLGLEIHVSRRGALFFDDVNERTLMLKRDGAARFVYRDPPLPVRALRGNAGAGRHIANELLSEFSALDANRKKLEALCALVHGASYSIIHDERIIRNNKSAGVSSAFGELEGMSKWFDEVASLDLWLRRPPKGNQFRSIVGRVAARAEAAAVRKRLLREALNGNSGVA